MGANDSDSEVIKWYQCNLYLWYDQQPLFNNYPADNSPYYTREMHTVFNHNQAFTHSAGTTSITPWMSPLTTKCWPEQWLQQLIAISKRFIQSMLALMDCFMALAVDSQRDHHKIVMNMPRLPSHPFCFSSRICLLKLTFLHRPVACYGSNGMLGQSCCLQGI